MCPMSTTPLQLFLAILIFLKYSPEQSFMLLETGAVDIETAIFKKQFNISANELKSKWMYSGIKIALVRNCIL